MKKTIKIVIAIFLCSVIAVPNTSFATESDEIPVVKSSVNIENIMPFDLDCKSAILMDYSTGTVLYEKNADEALPPASVTKVMTLLLVMEALDNGKISLEEKLCVSEYAASMGGSQVFLKPGEEMTVNDLLKSVVVSSANDAAVTLAEAVAGSETGFIEMMNDKAKELSMNNTVFENATGLDDTTVNHVTSARDIAIMSRELMNHPLILEYSSIWTDSIRDGAFGLSNTNRLIRFYSGATGLKTGSTAKAKFCISATALRDNLHLIAVIMGAPTRDIRNESAKKLLDYGFANYSLYISDGGISNSIKVTGGDKYECKTKYLPISVLVEKGNVSNISVEIIPLESIDAPVKEGDSCGKVIYKVGENVIYESELICSENINKINLRMLFSSIFSSFFMKSSNN